MTRDTIRKSEADRRRAVLPDPAATRQSFRWEDAGAMLDGLPGGGLNIAFEAVDRHVAHGDGERLALRWLGKDGSTRDLTYAELMRETARFANVLRAHGLQPGDRLLSLMGREVALYVAALGTLKAGLVFSPLFSAFGPEPIRTRMEIGEANAMVTTESIYRRKIAPWRHEIPSLRTVFLADATAAPEGCVALGPAMADAADRFEVAPTAPDDMALIHFTSGTTGRPKGAVHVHDAVRAHAATGRFALNLRPGAVYWCTADPGWVTGTSYGIISPLVNGATMLVDEADFDLDRWYATLERERVQIWYTAPTAIRMMMRAGVEAAQPYDFSALEFLASVGEPLNPEGVVWGSEVFGRPFHDNWWQTETGGIMIANMAAEDIRPGSMGRPLPGITAGVVDTSGKTLRDCPPGEIGELALRPGWPSMMRAYLNEPARYAKAFRDGWYLSGDLAMRDAEGCFWFVGRADDLIKSSGHLIGPFEVESALIEHPAVAEAGVIGLPDETAGEVVRAYVSLNPGYTPSEGLEREIRGHARKRLGAAVAPREVIFRNTLPKTRSGKIMRRLLKARELGLPEGDISTLETDET
ncbi:acetate--CoA ligase [Salipiger mucosus]|uniref:acetate--CoA ligase n=1 Tax=Salipiger mucosus DSM 16094 TaxID=1123237 RepID=S9QR86_9RHOB|nr:acetate--CoA ligase [Salipiger mucosus]EPX82152.1 Acetyl-coenzyme A synthetase [Salipiger mucosus DSM 16094]